VPRGRLAARRLTLQVEEEISDSSDCGPVEAAASVSASVRKCRKNVSFFCSSLHAFVHALLFVVEALLQYVGVPQ
jgi:hypothetical protein